MKILERVGYAILGCVMSAGMFGLICLIVPVLWSEVCGRETSLY